MFPMAASTLISKNQQVFGEPSVVISADGLRASDDWTKTYLSDGSQFYQRGRHRTFLWRTDGMNSRCTS